MAWLIILLSAAFIVGLALLVIGLRGRRVGDEPRCRKCNYELTGLDSGRCPECGREITPKATVRGLRRRYRAVWIPGLLLVALVVSVGGYRTYIRATTLTYYDYPTFALVWLAKRDDPKALGTLSSRLYSDPRDAPQAASIIPTALDRVATGTMANPEPQWSELLGVLDKNGVLTDAQRRRFHEEGLHIWLECRPRLRAGDQIQFDMRVMPIGTMGINSTVKTSWEIEIDGEQTPSTPLWPETFAFCPVWVFTGFRELPFAITLAPGAHQVRLTTKNAIKVGSVPGRDGFEFEKTIVKTYPLTVLPADAPDTVQLVDAPQLTQDFENVLTLEAAGVSPISQTVNEAYYFVVITQAAAVPMDAAFQIALVSNEHEIVVGKKVFRRKDLVGPTRTALPFERSKLRPDSSYSLVLRPDPDEARLTPDLFEIWGGELRFQLATREDLDKEIARFEAAQPIPPPAELRSAPIKE